MTSTPGVVPSGASTPMSLKDAAESVIQRAKHEGESEAHQVSIGSLSDTVTDSTYP
jgi:hypothetical protein